jgi:hypothetical protein
MKSCTSCIQLHESVQGFVKLRVHLMGHHESFIVGLVLSLHLDVVIHILHIRVQPNEVQVVAPIIAVFTLRVENFRLFLLRPSLEIELKTGRPVRTSISA